MKNIYVGNLNFLTTEHELRKLFETYGPVARVTMPKDRITGGSRGFAFVEMEEDAAADEAIRALEDSQLEGRTIAVNEDRRGPEQLPTP